ncbi:hypothetical protein M0Q97_13135 [Candidatus Dojkabacteria bacterium]|jgi:hypothetical protein|nr:hypothetical protein [Candidatus Dojkabacteria bacterium]
MNYILILAHTDDNIYKQANILILSLLPKNSYNIILYTDNINKFPNYFQTEIEIILLEKDEIKQMMGEYKFIHNVKINIIKQICLKKNIDKLIFIDSDCVVIDDINILFNKIDKNNFIMYEYEFDLKDLSDEYINIHNTISSNSEYINKKYNLVNKNYMSFNSGIIGGECEKLLSLIDNIYELSNYIYKLNISMISEQLAFSIIFNGLANINYAKNIIYHYWNNKVEVNKYIFNNIEKLNYNYQNNIKNDFSNFKNDFFIEYKYY